MSLRIELKPGEEILINGALLRAEKRRVNLRLLKNAQFLRGRDFMRAEDATTPARQLYFAAMQLCLSDAEPDRLSAEREELQARLRAHAEASDCSVTRQICAAMVEEIGAGHYYQALKLCKRLDPQPPEPSAATP